MKKTKTYEVSVINKTLSKTYSDQTKFYTSDTALELNFQLKEVEYDFDSAEIILLNVDDRSLVTRPVSKSTDGFTYELEDDIVAHYGEWKGQLKFDEGGEIYVSSPVSFRIENDLTNDRPPQLTEVNTWKNLRAIADGLIADIRSELELFEEKKLEIDTAESERQQAETQRASAESSRVSAEEQRKIDHSNRSAELAGKADKVVIKNLVTNGNFSQGTTGWVSGDTITVEGGVLQFRTSETSSGTRSVRQIISSSNLAGHQLYVTTKSKRHSDDTSLIRVYMYNGVDTSTETVITGGKGVWNNTSSIIIPPNSGSDLRLYLGSNNTNSGVLIEYDDILVIDLTETFGAGNELTKEEMDELIKATGYIDGEYALNNKDIMGHLLKSIREKADKKQEDWLYPTITNGIADKSSPPSFYKDEFGVVHLTGKINTLAGTRLTLFTLPVGYRPSTSEGYSVITGGGSFGYASVNNAGSVAMITGNTAYMLISGITFKAER